MARMIALLPQPFQPLKLRPNVQSQAAFVIGNIGISQLIAQDGEDALSTDEAERAIAMVRADALAVHLNYLEESVQPEGQTRAAGAPRAPDTD